MHENVTKNEGFSQKMGEMNRNKNPSIRSKDFIVLMGYTIPQKAVDPCFANR
jgi:hypothetical protein